MSATTSGASGVGLPRISRSDLQNHRVTVPGQQDEIYQPLYDSAVYVSATTLQLNFFSLPIGQGVTSAPGATGVKTEADTNLTNAGLLPLGNEFFCTGIEFDFFPGVNPGRGAVADATAGAFVNDIYAIAKSGWVRFRIQNRDYILDGPLIHFPSSARLSGFGAAATDLTTGAATYSEVAYASPAGQPYPFVPMYIESNQFFQIAVYWPAAITLPSAANMRLFARLRGRLIRDAQ
jgi:hypothetical protein